MKVVFETADDLASAGFYAGTYVAHEEEAAKAFAALEPHEQRELIGALCVLAVDVELAVAPAYADDYCEACEGECVYGDTLNGGEA